MDRRQFLQLLALAAAAGATLRPRASAAQTAAELYDVPAFGNVSLFHLTDVHAQLLPLYYREPNVNLGVGAMRGQLPHLVGIDFLKKFAIPPRSALAYAFTYLDFEAAARRFGKVGGFAHIATLVKRLRATRPHALLLDGGDAWQGTGVSLWTRGADVIGAQKLLGIDAMTGHWEFTYGAERIKQAVAHELAPIEFVAQNVKTVDFEDPVFSPYVLRTPNGVPIAIIGQAFPYTPIAHPRYFMPDWSFGIQERRLQKLVEEVRAKSVKAVILLSHNGMDVDLKLASRVRGIDVILGGHTHDTMPAPVVVGKTLVTNAGSNGKFLGVLDLKVTGSGVADYRYRLLPVFSNLLAEDPKMAGYVERVRKPHAEKLAEKLAVTEGLLYRRGNFNGSFDQLIVDALMRQQDAQIAFSPGFRWGTTLLPGEEITLEHLLEQTAITYPAVTVTEPTGEQIKRILEDVADNLFNPDPYLQQGGDMVRVGGMTYSCDPRARIGARISDIKIGDKRIEARKRYKVAGWASVAEGVSGEPVWDVVARHLRAQKTIEPLNPSLPRLIGVEGNPGIAAG